MSRTDSAPRFTVGGLLERTAVPLLLLVLVIYFGSTNDLFWSSANLQNLLANQSVTGLMALGMVLPLVAGYFDLAVPAIAGVSSVTFASVSGNHGQPVIVGILAALGVAMVAGCVNAALVALLRLSPFVTTFGVYVFLGGLLQWYTEGLTMGVGLPPTLDAWGRQAFLGLALPFWFLMIVAAVVWYVLSQTPFGRRLTAIGSNEAAGRLAGFRVDRTIFITFLSSALLGAVAGIVLTSRTLVADSSTAQGYLFPALAAVFLGHTTIRPGQYNVWGTMFGVFLVAVAVNGLTLAGAAAWVTDVFNGGALVVSVAASTLVSRRRDRKASLLVMQGIRDAAAATRHSSTQVSPPSEVER